VLQGCGPERREGDGVASEQRQRGRQRHHRVHQVQKKVTNICSYTLYTLAIFYHYFLEGQVFYYKFQINCFEGYL
jgi:hypothetical protein